MPTDVEYGLMAANVYESTRSQKNQIPAPAGWDRLLYLTSIRVGPLQLTDSSKQSFLKRMSTMLKPTFSTAKYAH